MVEEIKFSVIIVQCVRVEFFSYGVFRGIPQTKNEANNFNNKILELCKKYSYTHPGRSDTNFAVDGVSVDSKCVLTSL